MTTRNRKRSRVAALPVVLFCLAAGVARAGTDTAIQPESPGGVRWGLGDVVTIAIANHPSVGQADAEVRAAEARRGQAEAPRRPQAEATAAGSWYEATSSSSGDQERSTSSAVKATVSQLLVDFGQSAATVAQTGDLAAAAAQSARSSRVEVVYAAGLAYFNALRAVNLQGVRRETVRQREALANQAQAFFDAGVKARIDVVRAEANLIQARADATSADHDVRTSRLTLLNSMGLDGPLDFELEGVPAGLEVAGTLEDWLREADDMHPDLRALRLKLAAARNARLSASRGLYPTLYASGKLGWSGTDELPVDRGWSVGAELTVPLFDGHLVRQQTAESEADVVAAEFALENRRRQIRLLVERADQSLRDAVDQIAASTKAREAFAENLRLATGRYEAGAADIIEMIDAQLQMTQAETNLVEARFSKAVALSTLYRAIGRLPNAR